MGKDREERRGEGPPQPEEEGIRVTEAVVLEPDQNFYDQFPFRIVLAAVAKATGIEEQDVRYLVTAHYRNQERQSRPLNEVENPSDIAPHAVRNLLPLERRRDKGGAYRDLNLRRGLLAAIDTLDSTGLPYWREYIRSKQTQHAHQLDGSPVHQPNEGIHIYEPTYLSWVEEKLTREARIREKYIVMALGEAFPQQHEGRIPAEGRQRMVKEFLIRTGKGGRRRTTGMMG